jgi:hydrogenase nickel incorporation protein HypA/HybF
MHEIGIAEELSSIVLEAARRERLKEVSKVSISFGQMVQIVPEIFESAFRENVRNTIAENAELVITVIKVKLRCKKCGSEDFLDENLFTCKNCGSFDVEIINGKELFINSIEGE